MRGSFRSLTTYELLLITPVRDGRNPLRIDVREGLQTGY
jgi:hypothetical protein